MTQAEWDAYAAAFGQEAALTDLGPRPGSPTAAADAAAAVNQAQGGTSAPASTASPGFPPPAGTILHEEQRRQPDGSIITVRQIADGVGGVIETVLQGAAPLPPIGVTIQNEPQTTTSPLSLAEVQAQVAADGGTLVNRGGILVATFPDGSSVRYDPARTSRDGQTGYNPTYYPPSGASAGRRNISIAGVVGDVNKSPTSSKNVSAASEGLLTNGAFQAYQPQRYQDLLNQGYSAAQARQELQRTGFTQGAYDVPFTLDEGQLGPYSAGPSGIEGNITVTGPLRRCVSQPSGGL